MERAKGRVDGMRMGWMGSGRRKEGRLRVNMTFVEMDGCDSNAQKGNEEKKRCVGVCICCVGARECVCVCVQICQLEKVFFFLACGAGPAIAWEGPEKRHMCMHICPHATQLEPFERVLNTSCAAR